MAAHKPKPPIDFDLASTLAHHDAGITNLENRMTGVEQGMRSLEGVVQTGFSHLSNTLSEIRGRTGPGLGDILKVVATGGAVVAMASAAITMLVQSFISPELTELKDSARLFSRDHEARLSRDMDELRDLREARKDRIESEVGSLLSEVQAMKEKMGWAPEVRRAGGKGY